jgi:3-hydroxymyristoyl/3-hydroxydecanoyl-(acyl carrier protein) dehydratase
MRFLLFDKITHFEPGKSGVGVKNVSLSEDFFKKHYDQAPLMPESLIIEALAQVGGWTVAASTDFKYVAIMVRLDNVRFYRPVRPGDQIVLKVNLLSMNEYSSFIEGKAEVDGNMVAQIEKLSYVNTAVSDHLKDFVRKRYIYSSGGFLDSTGKAMELG